MPSESLWIICPSCGSSNPFPENDQRLLMCGCAITRSPYGYVDLRPQRNSLDRAFDELYQHIAEVDMSQAIQLPDFLEEKAHLDFSRLGGVKVGMRILEIGPGAGTLTRKLADTGAEVVCIDLTDEYWRQGMFPAERTICTIADAQNLPFIGQFDLVVMTDVLEHVLRPADVLFGVARALVPGGKLYVRSPAHEVLAPYGQLRGCQFPAVHLRTYSKSVLRAELVAVGFHVGRNIRADRSVRWRFPSSFAVGIRDRLQRRYGTENLKLSERANKIYRRSSGRFWRHLLTRPIEIWALAQVVNQVKPDSFTNHDMNYVGLIDLQR